MNRRWDLARRALGEVRFTDDLRLPRALVAKIVRCPLPHARIAEVDVSPALRIPGVICAITGKDLPGRFGILPWTPDENALAVEVARFLGDGVAAVAAIDEQTAEMAARAVRVA
jgi:CO/xanthine dehydrogenase Mo-binding subunit